MTLEASPITAAGVASERPAGRTLEHAAAFILMALALLWPALWNGFPIIFTDTGGYLARPFEGTLATGRSTFYGAFLVAGVPHSFWSNILLQAAVVIWMVLLILRLHGLGGRPWLAAAIVCGLSVFTSVPWYAAQLMPDIFVPISVLAVAVLAFHANSLRRWEGAVLAIVLAATVASHMSILALSLGLLVVLLAVRTFVPRAERPRPALLVPAAGIAAGVVMSLMSNLAVAGELAFTPGGYNFVFSRLLQDGIVARYLADHCPDPEIALCAYRAVLPQSADDWLWALNSPIYKLGGLEAFEAEARRIVLDSLWLYPLMHLETAALSAAKQFVAIATGDGINPWAWYTRYTFELFAPDALQPYIHSRQSTDYIDFTWMNLIHVPVQALAIAALPFVILSRSTRRIAPVAALMLAALIGNAVICGVLSNPHDRYQSRLAWPAALVVMIAALGRAANAAQRTAPHRIAPRGDAPQVADAPYLLTVSREKESLIDQAR